MYVLIAKLGTSCSSFQTPKWLDPSEEKVSPIWREGKQKQKLSSVWFQPSNGRFVTYLPDYVVLRSYETSICSFETIDYGSYFTHAYMN
jgi:hypothetical protein